MVNVQKSMETLVVTWSPPTTIYKYLKRRNNVVSLVYRNNVLKQLNHEMLIFVVVAAAVIKNFEYFEQFTCIYILHTVHSTTIAQTPSNET